MRRILFIGLWIAVILFLGQVVYFLFFSVRGPKYNEGRPLTVQAVSVPVQYPTALCQNGGDTVWIGTDGHGLHRYDLKDGKTYFVDGSDELTGKRIRCLMMDDRGRLWVGTDRDGLYVGSSEAWKHYDVGSRIMSVKRRPQDGTVMIAHDSGLVSYDPESDIWSDIALGENGQVIQTNDLAFDMKDTLYVATACQGIYCLKRDPDGRYQVTKHVTAKHRFGPGSAPNVAPVPLDACGEGLPSNQVNGLLIGSDETVWAATAAGLAWSRDDGDSWHFLRGRDYGEKMRGLIAGTPYQWKELPRIRFGELLPEDDLAMILEDQNGVLWITTRTLGCVAIQPVTFYRETLPKNDDTESAMAFLTDMAVNTARFHGTKADRIVSMVPVRENKVMLVSSTGLLETIPCPAGFCTIGTEAAKEEKTFSNAALPKAFQKPKIVPAAGDLAYPYAALLTADYTTGRDWSGQYGKTYALLGGGDYPHDQLVAFDESLVKIRPFVGNVGNRTRPLERTILARFGHSHAHHHHHHHHAHEGHDAHETEKKDAEQPERIDPSQITAAWSSTGDAVPKTYDGQHLWLDVKLNKPGRYRLSLYFVDPDILKARREKSSQPLRDHLVEIYAEPAKARLPKNDWQELGRRADLMATEQFPLAVGRVTDFGDGVYVKFDLAGPGTYYVKVDKNYSRKIELCSALVDKMDEEAIALEMPEKSEEQTPDMIP